MSLEGWGTGVVSVGVVLVGDVTWWGLWLETQPIATLRAEARSGGMRHGWATPLLKDEN